MEVVRDPRDMRRLVLAERAAERTIGLVPTMGYFHEGHLELMRHAAAECDVVVVSLFVNPTQFAPGEDFEQYPRDFERDRSMASREGVDYIFSPEPEDVYPEGSCTFVEVEGMSHVMCGSTRTIHFRGVATVVAKLFNIVQADRAYFGQKDAQQVAVLRRMALDLHFPVEVVTVPTVREADGLAMSSRNVYLGPEERKAATVLYRSLESARALIESGERSAQAVKEAVEAVFETVPLANLEYIVICDNIYLKPLSVLAGEVLTALAARVGRARLIDSMLMKIE